MYRDFFFGTKWSVHYRIGFRIMVWFGYIHDTVKLIIIIIIIIMTVIMIMIMIMIIIITTIVMIINKEK